MSSEHFLGKKDSKPSGHWFRPHTDTCSEQLNQLCCAEGLWAVPCSVLLPHFWAKPLGLMHVLIWVRRLSYREHKVWVKPLLPISDIPGQYLPSWGKAQRRNWSHSNSLSAHTWCSKLSPAHSSCSQSCASALVVKAVPTSEEDEQYANRYMESKLIKFD